MDFSILIPLLIPVFSQLFSKCSDPASGQNSDPKAEVLALRQPDGTFKQSAIDASRRHSKHAIKLANRGKRRRDPDWIAPNNENADRATIMMFEKVLATPKKDVLSSFSSGMSATFDPDDSGE